MKRKMLAENYKFVFFKELFRTAACRNHPQRPSELTPTHCIRKTLLPSQLQVTQNHARQPM
jgi:hypothetical protein